jgi:short-subunit dehydrogenase
MRIQGQVALITGASQGIGAACAKVLATRGARLALNARSREKLEEAMPPGALPVPGDLMKTDDRRSIVEKTVAHYGRIDILLNNAGIGLYAPAWRTDLQNARHMFELNFFAALEMTQLVVPLMRSQRSGMIVNVGSIAGKMTLPWFTLYSASKYAIGSLSDGLRMELKADGIHVMLVCPGYVKTGFQQHVLTGSTPPAIDRNRRFAITAERCAEDIAGGIERDARTVVTPRIGWALIALERLFPSIVDSRLERIYRDAEAGT